MKSIFGIIVILLLTQKVFAQSGELDINALLNNSGSLSSSEMLYIQQMMMEQRRNKPGTAQLFKPDSTNLFYTADSALEAPFKDTLVLDTIVPLQRYESSFFKNANPTVFSSTTSGVGGDYPLKPGDELVLTIWGGVEKEFSLVVNNQGKVNVESVGLVSLNGATLGAAEGILKTRLSRVFSGIRSGQTFVNLRLEKLSPVKIFLLGDVEKPGGYVLYGNTTVFQALYMAGGPGKEGSVRSIQVARGDSIFNVDLYDYLMSGKKAIGATLFDGDIVFLPRARILAEIDGAVGRPAIYELKEGEGIAELIQFAGGVNPDAAEHNMVLKRLYPDGRKDYETIQKPSDYITKKDSLALRNGDALMVFQSVEKSMQNTTILGAIKYPGTYQLKDSMNTNDLVNISGGLLDVGYSGRVHVLRAMPEGDYKLFSQNLNDQTAITLEPRDTLVVYSLKEMFQPDSVSIGGAIAKPGYYPYYAGMDAKDLILLAGGYLADSKKTSLAIDRLNDDRTVKSTTFAVPTNYDANKDAKIRLEAWDHVEIPYDSSFYRPELVVLAGAFKNPGVYSLNGPDETLENLVKRAGGFTPEAYLDGAKFFRRTMLKGDSSARDSTLGLVGIDISQTLKKEERNNIELQNGDSIHIPLKSISVLVHGEVGASTNVLWRKGADAEWYVNQAGGVKLTGDEDRVMITYANGSVALASEADRDPDPGSEVFVPYKAPPEEAHWTQYVSAFSTIVTALALVATTIFTIYYKK